MTTLEQHRTASLPARAAVAGFAAAIALWSAWFVTHLPWLGLSESVGLPILIAVWLVAGAAAIVWTGSARPLAVGPVAGIFTALISLLVLPSKLLPQATVDGAATGTAASNLPPVALAAVGFLVLGGVIGLVCGAIATALPRRKTVADPLAQLGLVVAVAITPLLVVGGLVTSTQSGMAVPDWPNTYGSNMFLYPLGPRSEPGRYLEHSHRLFGTLVGLLSLVLAVRVTLSEKRRWVVILSWVVFALICFQGALGGIRVLLGAESAALDKPIWAMLHGVLAQLVFGVAIGLAVTLTPSFRRDDPVVFRPGIKRFKVLATALTHSLILQLIFGAMYRHLRSGHALWTHAGFSLIIVILAVLAGFTAIGLGNRERLVDGAATGSAVGGLEAILRRLGIGLVAVVGLQFALGWVTFFVSGQERASSSAMEALVRTAHQANGAVVIALAAASFVWSKRLFRRAGK